MSAGPSHGRGGDKGNSNANPFAVPPQAKKQFVFKMPKVPEKPQQSLSTNTKMAEEPQVPVRKVRLQSVDDSVQKNMDPFVAANISNVIGMGFEDDSDDDCQIIEMSTDIENSILGQNNNIVPIANRTSTSSSDQEIAKTKDQPPSNSAANNNGNLHTEINFQEDENYNIEEYTKNDPWYQIFPLEELLPIMYENVAKSNLMKLGERMKATFSCLEYIESLRKSLWFVQSHGKHCVVKNELKRLMPTFEHLFQRILRFELDDYFKSELERLMDEIWKCHADGTVNFRRTNVLNMLLDRSPKYLDDSLAAIIKLLLFPKENDIIAQPEEQDLTKTTEFSTIIRLCQNSISFQRVFKTIFHVWKSTKFHPKILYFTQQFQKSFNQEILKNYCRLGFSYELISLYPTLFQPILYFLDSVDEFGKNGPVKINLDNILSNNLPIQLELLRLINNLYEIVPVNDEDQRNFIFFFLSSNSILSNFISDCYESKLLTFDSFPLLWTEVFYRKNNSNNK